MIRTHDNKELGQGHQLGFEELIDRALSQAPHLPPVREEREAGPEEAGEIKEDDEEDDEIEVKEFWCGAEWDFRIVSRAQPTVV